MKRTLLIICLATVAMNMSAQLVVDSVGRVGIGYNVIPNYPLTVSSYNYNTYTTDFKYAASFKGKHNGMIIDNEGTPYDNNSYITGLRVNNLGSSYNVYGVYSSSAGSGTGGVMCGVMGQSADAELLNIGVLGAKPGTTKKGAGIYGITDFYNYAVIPDAYSGSYAGYFKGDVRVTDNLYYNTLLTSAVNSPSASGSSTEEPLSARVITDEGDERISEKLQHVDLLQFVREDYDRDEETTANYDVEESENSGENTRDHALTTHNKLSAIQYGLAADQLKAVYPELVYEDENGNVSINYIELIPILVKGFNEIAQELAELKGTSAKKAKSKAKTTAVEETASEVDMVRMDQNKPNPFSESTVITLNVPENTQKANIFIYDMSGKQVKGIPVSERGETNITVYASNLSAGMYIYTLVVDGRVCVTRKMMVVLC